LLQSLILEKKVIITDKIQFPYIPGYLSFREAPGLLRLMETDAQQADICIFDGHGIAHPRGLGIAAHIGVLTQKASIGCAKKKLIGDYQMPGIKKGEYSDLVYKAFSQARDLEKAGPALEKIMNTEYKKLESLVKRFCKKEKIRYKGIDVSIATSINPRESVAYAFEKLALGKFGDVGTLAIARLVTETLKKVNIKQCGYSGLMLPVCEDYGLAKRNDEGTFDLTNLLLYSAVCGTGLDTIPLPGNVSEKRLYALLLDIASLSIKLNKPLSARLMPFPGKKVREMTTYEFEYFVNSKTMKI